MPSSNLRPLNFKSIALDVTPLDILLREGWRANQNLGALLRGKCPFHTSENLKSRSLLVTVHAAHCFKCHFHGDAIDVYARLRGVSKLQAAHLICEDFKLKPPYLQRSF